VKLACLTVAFVLSSVFAPAVFAQEWELGGGAGWGLYTSANATNGAETARARIHPGLGMSVWLANNTSDHWGGEIRYSLQKGESRLTLGSQQATFAGESHTIHYDFLWHGRNQKAAARPYFAFGAGVKQYRGTGAEQATQTLSRFALLTRTSEMRAMGSAGAGIKTRLSAHWQLRFDVHAYVTKFPTNIIAPNLGTSIGGRLGGWTVDILPTVGLSWTH
jgi:outer membrane protein W